jgi:predicted nucleotidyltransferase
MAAPQEKIKGIVDRIVETIHPYRIYLFGSQARETATEDSDIDLLIIADMEGSRLERNLMIQRLFPKRDFGLDVFVFKPEEFEHQRMLINSISYIVSKEGRILYEL